MEGRRYVVCSNEKWANKDATDREAIIAGLEKKLKKGAKSMVGNKGDSKYLASNGSFFTIDKEKIRSGSRYDGKWGLMTNAKPSVTKVALKYHYGC